MSLGAVRLEEGRRREGELCTLGRDRAASLRGYFSAWITPVEAVSRSAEAEVSSVSHRSPL